MLRSCRIQNFRCIKDLELKLGPMTALVGPNASGKSSILQALNPQKSWTADDVWQRERKLNIELTCTFDHGNPFKRVLFGTGHGGVPRFQLLRFDLTEMRRPNQVQAQNALQEGGGNLSNVFATFTRKQQADLARELCRLVPMFSDVDVRPTDDAGYQQIVLQDRWISDLWYDSRQVSDGTMLLLAFLALRYQTPPISIVAIEEPERGLHPYLLGEWIAFLRKLSSGDMGSPIQVILATHSAELLEFLRPEEVRFVSRRPEDGAVQVEEAPTSSPEWEAAFENYERSLGSAWLSGGLGGVPSGR